MVHQPCLCLLFGTAGGDETGCNFELAVSWVEKRLKSAREYGGRAAIKASCAEYTGKIVFIGLGAVQVPTASLCPFQDGLRKRFRNDREIC